MKTVTNRYIVCYETINLVLLIKNGVINRFFLFFRVFAAMWVKLLCFPVLSHYLDKEVLRKKLGKNHLENHPFSVLFCFHLCLLYDSCGGSYLLEFVKNIQPF